MAHDVASFPGQVDPNNTVSGSILNGNTLQGAYTDVSGFGCVQLMFTTNVAAGSYNLNVVWSDDGINDRLTETFVVDGPTALLGGGPTLMVPSFLSFMRANVLNSSGSTATMNMYAFLRPDLLPTPIIGAGVHFDDSQSFDPLRRFIVEQRSGFIDSRKVKTAFVDSAASGDITLVAAVASKQLRVLDLSIGLTATGTAIFFRSGAAGTQISRTFRAVANADYEHAAATGSFLFQTSAGAALVYNSSAAQAHSVGVSYIEV